MRKSLNRIAAAVTAAATVGSLVLTVAPVHAASLTSVKDTLSREQISITSVAHVIVTTLPAVSTNTRIVFAYGTAGFASLAQNGSSGTCAVGTCTLTVSSTDVQITCTSGPCSGLFTQAGTWTGTNPGTAGSKSITYSQAAGDPVSGSYAIPIVDSDQVTVTATVSPSITFDIDTAQTNTESAAPYTVALGTITTADSRVSGALDSVNFIWMDIDTNASGGAVITVDNAGGANGLRSTATPADDIDSTNGIITNGVENYGICVASATATTGSATGVSPFNGTCVANNQTPTVGGFNASGTTQDLITTNGGPIGVGRIQVVVAAAIDALTASHNDYTDTLTLIATGTF